MVKILIVISGNSFLSVLYLSNLYVACNDPSTSAFTNAFLSTCSILGTSTCASYSLFVKSTFTNLKNTSLTSSSFNSSFFPNPTNICLSPSKGK